MMMMMMMTTQRPTYIIAFGCCSFWYDEIRFRRILPFLKLRHLLGSFALFTDLLLLLQSPSVFLHPNKQPSNADRYEDDFTRIADFTAVRCKKYNACIASSWCNWITNTIKMMMMTMTTMTRWLLKWINIIRSKTIIRIAQRHLLRFTSGLLGRSISSKSLLLHFTLFLPRFLHRNVTNNELQKLHRRLQHWR